MITPPTTRAGRLGLYYAAARARLIVAERLLAIRFDQGARDPDYVPAWTAKRDALAAFYRIERIYERCLAVEQANHRKRFARSQAAL